MPDAMRGPAMRRRSRAVPAAALPGLVLAVAVLALTGCAGQKSATGQSVQATQAEQTGQSGRSPAQCGALYVAAPGSYIIELAAGGRVVLDPSAHDFPVFCTPDEARAALDAQLDAGRLPPGDWRIYRLEGAPAGLTSGAGSGPGMWLLERQAALADWVTDAARTP